MIITVCEKCEGTCEGCYYDNDLVGCQHPNLSDGIGCADGKFIFAERTSKFKAAVRFRHLSGRAS